MQQAPATHTSATSGADGAISPAAARRALIAFLVIGFVLRMWVALAVPRIAHIDEILQTEEPAHYLAYGYGLFTWEWTAGIRSWVFPAFLAGVMKATAWMGAGSSGYLLGIKLVLSLLSLTTIGFAFAFARRARGNEAAIIAAGCCALWFSMVDYAPRALTEVVSAHLFLPALYLGIYAEKLDERKRMLAAGLLCGLAAGLRMQYAPAIGFALLWFCFSRSGEVSETGSARHSTEKASGPQQNTPDALSYGDGWKNRAVPLALGVLLPVLIFGLADAVTWSYPFSSFVRYFSVDIGQGVAARSGSLPWYWYATNGLWQALGPLPVFALVGALVGAPFGLRRSPFLSWLAAIVLVSHSAIAHKEARYLYLLWPIAIVLAAIGTVEIAAAINRWAKRAILSARTVIATSLAFSAIVLIGMLIGFHYFGRAQGMMALFDDLSRDPQLCGVGVVNDYRLETGGYTHLDRDVPILYFRDSSRGGAELSGAAGAYNALVSGTMPLDSASGLPAGFALERCRYKSCLYVRPGGCAPAATASATGGATGAEEYGGLEKRERR